MLTFSLSIQLALKDLYDKPWTRGSPFFFGVLAHWCVHKRREWITTRFALRKADGYGTPRTLAAGRSALLRGSVKDLGSPLTASHWDDDILTSSQSIAVRVLSALISLLMAAVASAVVLFGAGDNLGGQLCSWLDVCAGKALGRAVLLQLLLARALFGAVCAWLIYAIEIESDPGAELAPDGSEQSRSWAARFLSLRLFAPVARLSYSAYLIQFLAMGLLPNALLASGSERIPLRYEKCRLPACPWTAVHYDATCHSTALLSLTSSAPAQPLGERRVDGQRRCGDVRGVFRAGAGGDFWAGAADVCAGRAPFYGAARYIENDPFCILID